MRGVKACDEQFRKPGMTGTRSLQQHAIRFGEEHATARFQSLVESPCNLGNRRRRKIRETRSRSCYAVDGAQNSVRFARDGFGNLKIVGLVFALEIDGALLCSR